MKRLMLLAAVGFGVASKALANDTQLFYRAGLMSNLPHHFVKKAPARVSLRAASGSTHTAFDGHENKTALFNANGAFDLLRLGSNIDNLDRATMPQTFAFWDPAMGHWGSAALATPAGKALSANDGKVVYGGNFSITDASVQAQVPFYYGLYIQAFVPFSKFTVSGIKATNVGATDPLGQNMANFVTTSLPLILKEHGIQPITDVRRSWDIGDPVLSLGWEGYSAHLAPLVTEVAGYMQLGFSLPAASAQDANVVFDLPRGHNGHLGCICRGALEANLFDYLTVGVQAGSSVFFHARRNARLKTDLNQNGWIVLEKVPVSEDYGSLWDIGGYLGVNKLIKGLRALVGYTFTCQERTTYDVRDGNYLSTKIAAEHAKALAGGIYELVLPNNYADSDTRLQGWETHVLRAAVQVNTAEMFGSGMGVLASVEYNLPILGKYSWTTDMIAGSLGCSFSWHF
ncbi:hypothetical protein FJ365_01695 [Candidatus Dependentiae bacterium]|nr:hypothetical protein [Candidatus Dependentiae bacterium]